MSSAVRMAEPGVGQLRLLSPARTRKTMVSCNTSKAASWPRTEQRRLKSSARGRPSEAARPLTLSARCSATSDDSAPAHQPERLSSTPPPTKPTAVVLALAATCAALVRAALSRFGAKVKAFFAPLSAAENARFRSSGLHKLKLSGGTLGPLCFAAISQAADNASSSTPLTVIASGMAKWLELYSGLLLIRVLLSWFPNIDWERQPLQAIRDMSDPYLNLFRNIMPPFFGALDLSPMLAFLVLGMLTSLLNTTIYA